MTMIIALNETKFKIIYCIYCPHLHVRSAFEGQGEDVIEYLECSDCHKDLRGELPELDPATLADQLANEEE
jgi:hypothetical protein